MIAKQIFGIVFCLVAAVFLVQGVRVVLDPPELEGPSSTIVSYAVGAFLPSLGFLILGAWLLQQPKSK